ncbi:MAG: hypothetical protein GC168_09255 [Candidatus Hydrogenedens sp.]|nr:hypothetical protein [Candidatus Hydrogenedens sp.]
MAINSGEGGSAAPKRRTKRTTKTIVEAAGGLSDDEIVVRKESGKGSALSGFMSGGVASTDVTTFLRQLIMLLEAGTPILKSLKTLSERGKRAAARALVADIAMYVEAGNPLWQAFDRHPRYFDSVFVNLIKASEASGTLVTVLRRSVDYRTSRELLAKRVKGAMVYPILLVVACFAVVLLLAYFVVPQFKELFEKANLEIPEVTKKFLAISEAFTLYWWVPIVALFLLYLVYRFWFLRSPVRRLIADRIRIRIPVVGHILHKNAIVEMTRTMALLLRSGVSMMSALDLTRNAIHNLAVGQVLQHVRDNIEGGGGLEAPLRAASPVIPDVVTDMMVTGEDSGRVDAVCEQIADIYEEEVEIAVSTIGEAIQPIFTVIVGGIVMLLFVALFLPMVSMIQQLQGG